MTGHDLKGRRIALFYPRRFLHGFKHAETKKIMKNKAKPNKANRRADVKRTQKNREILKQLAGK